MDFDNNDIQRSLAPRPRPPGRRPVLRCLGFTCGIVGLLVAGVVAYFISSSFWELVQKGRDPHKSLLYANADNVDARLALTAAQVVRPLIDLETRFDVALTIWARIPNGETETEPEPERAAEYAKGIDWDESDYTPNQITAAGFAGRSPVEIKHFVQEKMIYSGVVLRDVSLNDRDLETQVKFKLPLKRFYDRYLYHEDVRIGFAIIPTVDSKLARLDDFTEWRPENMDMLPKIDVEYMARTPLNARGEDDSNRWDALEHMARAYSLVEFHEREHPCGPASNTSLNSSTNGLVEVEVEDDDDLYASVRLDDDDDDVDVAEEAAAPAPALAPAKPSQTRRDINEKMHPHLVTRSHIYIMNETRLFDRKAFDARHKTLRQTSCGQALPGGVVTRFLCGGDYRTNGHWETRLILSGQGEGAKKELAYGPFIGSLHHAAGPKDVVPLPVTRLQCPKTEQNVTTESDPEYLDVTYNLHFSSLTPGRVHMLDNMVQPARVPHNATDHERVHAHNTWEQTYGLFGVRASGTHPWRRLAVSLISDVVLLLPIGLLIFIYWYTRTTSAGINRHGGLIGGVSSIVRVTVGLVVMFKDEHEHEPGWLTCLMFTTLSALELSPAWFQLRLVSPIEVGKVGWGLNARRKKVTHRERASDRRGTQVSWAVWTSIYLALFTLIYATWRYDRWLVRPSLPPTAEDLAHHHLFPALGQAGTLLAVMMQLQHNRRNGAFAGQYALTAGLEVARRLVGLLYFSPSFIGRLDTRDGLRVESLGALGLEFWALYQALTLPKVAQGVVDEDGE